MSDESVFGPYIDETIVEENVRDALHRWLPTYLAHADYRSGKDRGSSSVVKPRAYYSTADNFDATFFKELPAIIVICGQFAQPPVREGDGTYRAFWTVAVGAVVKANSRPNSKALAARYSWAVVKSLVDHPSLGNPSVHGITWMDRGLDDIPNPDTGFVNASRNTFVIEYRGVLRDRMGPAEPTPSTPPTEPTPSWGVVPDIDHVQVGLSNRSPEEEI